jgi:hypothetical protein
VQAYAKARFGPSFRGSASGDFRIAVADSSDERNSDQKFGLWSLKVAGLDLFALKPRSRSPVTALNIATYRLRELTGPECHRLLHKGQVDGPGVDVRDLIAKTILASRLSYEEPSFADCLE